MRCGERDLALILDNLVENAIKYSPRGSDVEIDWRAANGAAALVVANEGGPLSEEDRELAFERFHRGKGSRRDGGTGLGLPIVAALARRSGGSARLRNDGTRVRRRGRPAGRGMTLPVSNPRPLRSPA